MSKPLLPSSGEAYCSGNSVQLSICHEDSNSKFAVKFSDPEHFSEKNGLKRLLRVVVPKVRENAKICGTASAAVLSYRDEDGDMITVRTDSDLKEAVRLASHRQISINITFEEGLQTSFGLDSSTGASGVSWPDSSSDAQIECEKAAPDPASDIPSVTVLEPINAVSGVQPAVFAASSTVHSSVDLSQRILLIEQALQQQRLQIREAVEDINRAHAQDRVQLNQANKGCAAAVEEVRHDCLEVSTRLGVLEAACLELKSTATSGQDAIAACFSDAATHNAALQDLQRKLKLLQQTSDYAQQKAQEQLCSDGFIKEMQLQCQHLQNQLEGIQQHQLRYAQLENQQTHFSDRLSAVEQFALQCREHQLDSQQKLRQLLERSQQDRDDMKLLIEDKFAAMSLRMSQLESHRESWTAIERLVLSSSSSSGSVHQALRPNHPIADASSHHQDFTGSDEISGSYVSLQTSHVSAAATIEVESRPSLQVVSVSVHLPQRDPLPLQLHTRGDNLCSTDADFSVSIGVSVLSIVDLQVTFENVSNSVVPEDVEFRLVSQSRGVSRATQTMHKIPRTKKPMLPKDNFTFIVCCTAPGMASAFPSRFLWQPYSAGAAIGSSLAVILEGRS